LFISAAGMMTYMLRSSCRKIFCSGRGKLPNRIRAKVKIPQEKKGSSDKKAGSAIIVPGRKGWSSSDIQIVEVRFLRTSSIGKNRSRRGGGEVDRSVPEDQKK